MTHTPTPWEVGRYNDIVFDGEIVAVKGFALSGGPTAEANAAFIVKAVNAHDKLVEALTWALAELRGQTRYDNPQQALNCFAKADEALEGLE